MLGAVYRRRRGRPIRADEKRTAPVDVTGPGRPAVHPDQFRPAPDQWPGHRIRFPRPWTESPERSLLADEAVGLVGLELVLLPQLQFLVVSLRDIGRLRAAGVCALLDLTAANQRVLLHSGRAWIRKVLTGYFQAVP